MPCDCEIQRFEMLWFGSQFPAKNASTVHFFFLKALESKLLKLAKVFNVRLDYLVGEGQNASFDKKTLQRLQELELLDESKRKTLFDLIDTYVATYSFLKLK